MRREKGMLKQKNAIGGQEKEVVSDVRV